MKSKKLISSLLLILISVAWGGSFVAQSKGGNLVGPLSYGFIRFFIAGLGILPVIKIIDLKSENSNKPKDKADKRELVKDGIICGIFLAGTSAFQQLGMFMGTASGKAGFLTSCNVIFVPLIGLFFKDKVKANIWIAVGVTVVGLYLLCINDGFNVQVSDLLVLFCAVMNASRIIAVDRFKDKTDTARLACVQFFSASILLGIIAFIFEIKDIGAWWITVNQWAVWGSLLYAALIAGTFAFTIQIVAQKNVDPTVSSLLMSTEAVFAVLAGWLLLGDKLSVKELIGCATIFVAITIAQLPSKTKDS